MKFSKTTEYSLRILSHMSLNENELHSAEGLYERLKIPKKYLQRILTDLARSGFIQSIRGRNGGFTFSRSIDKIYLSEIINATEGLDWTPKCMFGFGECALDSPCKMHDLWVDANQSMLTMLSSTTLADLKSK